MFVFNHMHADILLADFTDNLEAVWEGKETSCLNNLFFNCSGSNFMNFSASTNLFILKKVRCFYNHWVFTLKNKPQTFLHSFCTIKTIFLDFIKSKLSLHIRKGTNKVETCVLRPLSFTTICRLWPECMAPVEHIALKLNCFTTTCHLPPKSLESKSGGKTQVSLYQVYYFRLQ